MNEPARDGERDRADRLDRIERKLDRLLQLVVLLLFCQPILLVGLLMPGVAMQAICYLLLAILVALAIFPNLETKLPSIMRSVGTFVGRMRRRLRSLAMR